ncbi:MAG: Hsp20 family protein [Verrucomicrobiota bacterium]
MDEDDYKLRFRLNGNLDTEKIKAVVEHGLLTLTLPIREEAKPRAIEIS